MKHLTFLTLLSFTLLGSPSWAQPAESGTATPRQPEILQQMSRALGTVQLREDQVQALMGILLREAPNLLDDHPDALALGRKISPEIQGLLDPAQLEFLKKLDKEQAAYKFGTLTSKERKALVQDGMRRLTHPDTDEWLRRIDSFDI